MTFYIATSDISSYILRPYAHQFNKYCNNKIWILGYTDFPELPNNFKCVSLATKQNNINEWCINLYNYFEGIDDEFIIFGLDDFLIINPFDEILFNEIFEIIKKDKLIGRYEFGTGHYWHEKTEIIYNGDGFEVYQYGNNSEYRISTQYSLWRRDYLLKYINHKDWSPFDFERKGSDIAKNDNYKIIATRRRYVMRWVESGAISNRHPGKINILGMKESDIKELIELKLVDKTKLQYGMAIENNKKYI